MAGIGEDGILAAQAEGKRMADRPQSLLPNFRRSRASSSVGETIFNALTGAAAGLQAGRGVAGLGSPALSALTGLAGGMQAPTFVDLQAQRDAALAQAQMQQLEAVPLGQVSEAMGQKYPELADIPLGAARPFLPLMGRQDQYERSVKLMILRDKLADENRNLTEDEVAELSPVLGIEPGKLRGMRSSLVSILMPTPLIDPRDGSIRYGPPRARAYTPPVEMTQKTTLSQDAISNLNEIEQFIKSDAGWKLVLKAGGSYSKLKSLGDPQAEILGNAIFQAADAESRVKTGAAINEQEIETYWKQLVNPLGTKIGNLDRVSRKKKFFNSFLGNAGVAAPSSDSVGGQPPPAGNPSANNAVIERLRKKNLIPAPYPK